MMKSIDLFLAHEQVNSLEEFARRFFDRAEISGYAERESSHYVDETYFIGAKNDMVFRVALNDEAGFDDLPFWLSVSAEAQLDLAKTLVKSIDDLVVNTLAPDGFRVARIQNFGRLDMSRHDY